jgi:hypothetical protein
MLHSSQLDIQFAIDEWVLEKRMWRLTPLTRAMLLGRERGLSGRRQCERGEQRALIIIYQNDAYGSFIKLLRSLKVFITIHGSTKVATCIGQQKNQRHETHGTSR